MAKKQTKKVEVVKEPLIEEPVMVEEKHEEVYVEPKPKRVEKHTSSNSVHAPLHARKGAPFHTPFQYRSRRKAKPPFHARCSHNAAVSLKSWGPTRRANKGKSPDLQISQSCLCRTQFGPNCFSDVHETNSPALYSW